MSEHEIDAVEPGGSGAVPLPALSPGVGGAVVLPCLSLDVLGLPLPWEGGV